MNPFIGIIFLLFYVLLFFAGFAFIAVIYNLVLSLFGKIFRMDLKVKHVHAAVYSENRITEEQVSHAALDNQGGPF